MSPLPPTPSTTSKLSPPQPARRKKVTLRSLNQMYTTGVPISVVTAYDFPTARFLEQAGIDICLVGDSLAMVACGYASTNEIGMDEMLYHCRAVARGAKLPLLVADMPFGSHQASMELGITNAIRLVKEGGMEAVKVEGGKDAAPFIKRLVDMGIPVMGHVGLTPQRQAALSGFRIQGKTAEGAMRVAEDARIVQEAGAFAIVLEAIPAPLAKSITEDLKIPTIGIGASSHCSGQVLVQSDMLGMTERVPKFCKKFLRLADLVPQALRTYADEVKARSFPDEENNTYEMPQEEWRRYLEMKEDAAFKQE